MMKYLTTAMIFATATASAATNISTTLNMVSPTGLISCTGVGCTVSATLGYFKNISGTITGGVVGGVSLASDSLIRAKVVFNGGTSPVTILRQWNITSVDKAATGRYVLNGTFPTNPVLSCTASIVTLGSTVVGLATIGSPTTTSITLASFNTATSASQDLGNINCSVN